MTSIKIRYSKGRVSSITNIANVILNKTKSIKSKVNTMNTQAIEHSKKFMNFADSIQKKDDYYYPRFNSNKYPTYELARSANVEYITSKTNAYRMDFGAVKKAVDDCVNNIEKKFNSVKSVMQDVSKAVDEFESINISLKLALEKLEKSGAISLEGISFDTVKTVNGVEVDVVKITYIDENGEEVTLTIAEATNAFYTYVGTATSGAIANELFLDEMGISKDSRGDYRLRAVMETGAYVDNLSENGVFGLASKESINKYYEILSSDNSDLDKDMEKEYQKTYESAITKLSDQNPDLASDVIASILNGQTNSNLTSAGAVLLPGIVASGAFSLNNKISEEDQKKIDAKKAQLANNNGDQEDELSKENIIDEVVSKKTNVENVTGIGNNIGGNEIPEEILPGEEEIEFTEEIPEDKPDLTPTPEEKPFKQWITDEQAEIISKDISKNLETQIPEPILNNKLSRDDIDAKARDEYYSKYTEEELGDIRGSLFDAYNNMNETEKSTALKGLGYSDNAVMDLVTNGAAGVTAYVIGNQNFEMTKISNQIAANEGIFGHDTIFDDPISSSYIMSGQATSDLIPSNAQVQAARQELNQAKASYDNAVTKANSSINEAKTAKADYQNKVEEIKNNSGEDPKKWTKDDIKEYNEVADNYNQAVNKANNAVKEVEVKKSDYERSKIEYEKTRQELVEQTLKQESNIEVKENGQTTVLDTDNSSNKIETSVSNNVVETPNNVPSDDGANENNGIVVDENGNQSLVIGNLSVVEDVETQTPVGLKPSSSSQNNSNQNNSGPSDVMAADGTIGLTVTVE